MSKNNVKFRQGIGWPDFMTRHGREKQCRQEVNRCGRPQDFRCLSAVITTAAYLAALNPG